MAKKRCRATKVSKGIHSNVSKSTLHLMRVDRAPGDKEINKVIAWRKGQNPWMTVKNPTDNPSRLYIRVRANDLLGDPRNRGLGILNKKEADGE